MILLARKRVGEELDQAPIGHGGDRRSSRAQSDLKPTLAEQVGSQDRGSRLKKLAGVAKTQLEEIAKTLWAGGAEATQTAVLKITNLPDATLELVRLGSRSELGL